MVQPWCTEWLTFEVLLLLLLLSLLLLLLLLLYYFFAGGRGGFGGWAVLGDVWRSVSKSGRMLGILVFGSFGVLCRFFCFVAPLVPKVLIILSLIAFCFSAFPTFRKIRNSDFHN